ncbi:HEXXH motif domain-containing protein [Frankia sp. AgPm24]|uniref:HEXXH motif domain-containing protein n=1 Tax=Frankia sp. AgPm24 TaxID=631128 RepID=UPI00200BB704|nr:HEXXH motif domain-containing protein [Frankia sp. AgPm24]MCK9923873.1 HEXXH motif domain-containing protein [Frankia sp. AgPm24]
MPAVPPGPARSDPAVGLHRLSGSDLDSLALGGLEPAVVRRLLDAEISHRRIAMRAVLELLGTRPQASGPLAPVDEAWQLLVEAERRSPPAVRAVLDQPFTGAWAARLLRRLRDQPPAGVPLWVDVGYLHALAAAAAVRAGCAGSLTVPARHGVVHLPSLGHAHLMGLDPWDIATVTSTTIDSSTTPGTGTGTDPDNGPDNGPGSGPGTAVWIVGPADRVRVPGPDQPGGPPAPDDQNSAPRWRRTRTVDTGLIIEDADPYRRADSDARPEWLPAAEISRWERRLGAAREVLRTGHPGTAAAVDAAILTVVPAPSTARFRSFSATSGDAVGSVVMSMPTDAVDGAVTLVHEVRHCVLGALLHLGELVDPAAAPHLRRVPWRDDPRPARSALQGVYAFFGVTDFWRTQRRRGAAQEAMLAHLEFALGRRAVWETAWDLLRTGPLTALGRRFVTGVVTTVTGWLTEPVPAQADRLAELVTADARALWELHHLAVAPRAARALAAAWRAGDAAPVGSPAPARRLEPDPDVRALDTRACLARLWLADRDALRRIERDEPARAYRGATTADCALIRGDHDLALTRYAALLRQPGEQRGQTGEQRGQPGEQRRRALVGLGLALGERHPAGRVLLRRPDLVAAVAREITGGALPARLVELAGWLAPLVPAREQSGQMGIGSMSQSSRIQATT